MLKYKVEKTSGHETLEKVGSCTFVLLTDIKKSLKTKGKKLELGVSPTWFRVRALPYEWG